MDGEEMFEDFAKEIKDERLETNVSSFEDFDYQENTYDLINAQYSLPFMKKEYFDDVILKIQNSLKINGVFVGTFFGDKDGWNNKVSKTENFQTKEEIEKMFENFEILELLEKEEDKPAVNKELKHWHTLHITAKKL
jgi:tellurite methyltransferase